MTKCTGTVNVKSHTRDGFSVSSYTRKCGNHNDESQKDGEADFMRIPSFSKGASKKENREFSDLAEKCMVCFLKIDLGIPLNPEEISKLNEYGLIEKYYPALHQQMVDSVNSKEFKTGLLDLTTFTRNFTEKSQDALDKFTKHEDGDSDKIPSFSKRISKEDNYEFKSLLKKYMSSYPKADSRMPLNTEEIFKSDEYSLVEKDCPTLHQQMVDSANSKELKTGLLDLASLTGDYDKKSKKAFSKVVMHEGGYSDHPADSGGKTNYGVTQTTLNEYHKNNPGSKIPEDVKEMTKAGAHTIFKNVYWKPIKGDDFKSQQIAQHLVDFVYNSGQSSAVMKFQEVLKEVTGNESLVADSVIGKKTLKAVNGIDYDQEKKFHKKFVFTRGKYLIDLIDKRPKDGAFFGGWMNRIKSFLETSEDKEEFNKTMFREYAPVVYQHYYQGKKLGDIPDPKDKSKTIAKLIDKNLAIKRLLVAQKHLGVTLEENHRNLFLINPNKELKRAGIKKIMDYPDIKEGIKHLQSSVNKVIQKREFSANQSLIEVDGDMGAITATAINGMTEKERESLNKILQGIKEKGIIQSKGKSSVIK